MYIQAVMNLSIRGCALLAQGSNVTSAAHAALRHLKVSRGPITLARMLLTGVALVYFWSNPLAGLVAQVAARAICAGFEAAFAKKADFTHEAQGSSKAARLAYNVFSTAIFPLKMLQRLHEMAGNTLLLPSSFLGLCISWGAQPVENRRTLTVCGTNIDVYLDSNSTITSDRWLVVANPNGMIYEQLLWVEHIQKLAQELGAHIAYFNYPGTGYSEGMPNRWLMVEAQRTVWIYLACLVGAKQIVNYGWSLGGAVQSEASVNFNWQRVGHVSIKDRTFSTLSKVARSLMGWPGALAASLSGWDFNAVANVPMNHVVLQATWQDLIADDGVISAEASFARAAVQDERRGIALANGNILVGVEPNSQHSTQAHMRVLGEGEIQDTVRAVNERL